MTSTTTTTTTTEAARQNLRQAASGGEGGRSVPSSLLRKYPKTSLVLAIGAGIAITVSPVARKAAITMAVQYLLRR